MQSKDKVMAMCKKKLYPSGDGVEWEEMYQEGKISWRRRHVNEL